MNNKAKNGYFNIVLLIVCSFVGVGFITGSEIWYFFSRFNINAIAGLIAFAFFCYNLVLNAFKDNSSNNKFAYFEFFVSLFSEIMVASAMLSGLNFVAKNLFNNYWFLFYFASIILIIILLFLNFKSLLIYNYFVIGFILFVALVLVIFIKHDINNFNNNFSFIDICKSFYFGVLYIFMNISEVRPIISCYGKNIEFDKRKSFAKTVAFILSILIFVFVVFMINLKNLSQFSMPFLLYFNSLNSSFNFIFCIGILLCMISTSISCLNGFCLKANKKIEDIFFCKTISILISLVISHINFVYFVKIIYPVIAFFNLILFFAQKFLKK